MPGNDLKMQPLISDIRRMWHEIELTHVKDTPEDLQRLLNCLRADRANGGVEFALFTFRPHPVLDWFSRLMQFIPPHFDFASEFVTHPVVRQALPKLAIPEKLTESLKVIQLGCFDLEAGLNQDLLGGGAYAAFQGTRAEARQLVAPAMNVLEQDDYMNLWVGLTNAPWLPWFHNVAWDSTWIGFHRTKHQAWVLCLTDSD